MPIDLRDTVTLTRLFSEIKAKSEGRLTNVTLIAGRQIVGCFVDCKLSGYKIHSKQNHARLYLDTVKVVSISASDESLAVLISYDENDYETMMTVWPRRKICLVRGI